MAETRADEGLEREAATTHGAGAPAAAVVETVGDPRMRNVLNLSRSAGNGAVVAALGRPPQAPPHARGLAAGGEVVARNPDDDLAAGLRGAVAVRGDGPARALGRQSVARFPPPDGTTAPGTPGEQAAKELYDSLTKHEAMKDGEQREGTLTTALKLGNRYEEIKAAWPKVSGRTIEEDIRANAGTTMDAARIFAYLRYGRLRTADKIYMAVAMTGTDEGSLFRLLLEAQASGDAVSKDFATDYGTEYPADGKLLDGKSDRIAGVLGDGSVISSGELSGGDWVKGMAHLTFGKLRPVDKIRIAIVETSMSDDAVNAAISEAAQGAAVPEAGKAAGSALGGANQVEKDYHASYGNMLSDDLAGKLGADSASMRRAKLFLSGKFTARERIRIAVEGLANDWAEIWSALKEASHDELGTLRGEWESKGEIYTLINGTTGELTTSNADLDRIRAVFKAGAKREGETVTVKDLLTARGLPYDAPSVVKAALEEAEVEQALAAEMAAPGFAEKTSGAVGHPIELAQAKTLTSGTWSEKIGLAAGVKTLPGVRRLLFLPASDTERKKVRENDDLMGRLRAIDGFGELEMQLAPTDPIERHAWLHKHVVGEDLGSRESDSGAALADEMRELDAAVGNVKDKQNLTPEEKARLANLQGKSEAALGVYARWRDEMQAMTVQALSVAGALILTAITGGAGAAASYGLLSAEFATHVAQVALANAVMDVAIQGAVKGDRLDLSGAESAFVGGAVRGAAFAVAAVPAGALSTGYIKAMSEAAPNAAAAGYKSVAPGLIKTMAEGGIGSSLSAGVETAAKADTWKKGFIEGVAKVVDEMFVEGVMGAGIGAVTHGAIEIVKATLFPAPGGATPAKVAPAGTVDGAVAQRNALGIIRAGSAPWEHWVKLAEQMGEHQAAYKKAVLDARRQLAAEICVALEPDLERAGYTWELKGGATLEDPLTLELKPHSEPPPTVRGDGSGDTPPPAAAAGETPEEVAKRVRKGFTDQHAATPEQVKVEIVAQPNQKAPRVTEPVPGLYDAVDPKRKAPDGWVFTDVFEASAEDRARIANGEPPTGEVRISTVVTDPEGKKGHVIRSYDPHTGVITMEEAFLNGVTSKVPAEVPFGAPGADTPLQAYITMRQMKMFGLRYGAITKVKMSTIHNIVTICQLHQWTIAGVEPPSANLMASASVDYAQTTIVQSGHKITSAKLTGKPYKTTLKTLRGWQEPQGNSDPIKNQKAMTDAGLTDESEVMYEFDIELETRPYAGDAPTPAPAP